MGIWYIRYRADGERNPYLPLLLCTVDLMTNGILGEARVRGYQNNC